MCNLSTDKHSFISLLLDIYNNVEIILKTIKKSLKLTVQTLNIFYLQRGHYATGTHTHTHTYTHIHTHTHTHTHTYARTHTHTHTHAHTHTQTHARIVSCLNNCWLFSRN